MRSGFVHGIGFSNTVSTTENRALVAPIPKTSIKIAVMLYPGRRSNVRQAMVHCFIISLEGPSPNTILPVRRSRVTPVCTSSYRLAGRYNVPNGGQHGSGARRLRAPGRHAHARTHLRAG